jgi:hypothetical protein
MANKLERTQKEAAVAYLSYYSVICLDRMRTKTLERTAGLRAEFWTQIFPNTKQNVVWMMMTMMIVDNLLVADVI